jgi:hypothetical protein
LNIVDGFATGRTFTASSGGGIYNDHATLTVSNCVLSGNAAVESGGAIFNNGAGSNPNTSSATLTLVNCTLDGNSTHRGGGIYSDGTGNQATVTILNSTLSNNSGDYYGGGIGTDPGTTLTVRNSTFSGNATGGTFGGGGISGYASAVTVTGSTFTGNTANGGAGHGNCIYTEVGTLSIGSTILNSIGNNIYNSPVGAGTVVSLGYNLRNSADILLTNPNDRVGSPMLGPLQDNGGPTLTCALLPGSPAIDRGKNLDASVNDQRGSARTYDDLTTTNAMGGDGTDIGAFEVQRTIQLAIESDGSGGLFVRFTGEPDVTYRLQRAASVTGAWANLATNTAPASGLIEYHETTPPPGQAFYRTVQP